MDVTVLKKQRDALVKKKDNITYERKQYLKEYNELKDIVTKTGIICLVCLFLMIVIIPQFISSKDITAIGLGRYLTPFILAVFMFSMIIFLTKGFNLFVNADTEWSKKAADKLKRIRFADKLEELNSVIIRIDIEINRLEEELKKSGVDISDEEIIEEKYNEVDNNVKKANIKEKKKQEEKKSVKKSETKKAENKKQESERAQVTKVENKKQESERAQVTKIENKKQEIKETFDNKVEKTETKNIDVKKDTYKQKDENVNDLLNALDSWGIEEDDEEDEISSSLWKKDSKMLE